MVRVIAGSPPVRPVMGDQEYSAGFSYLEGVRIGKYVIPVDETGSALVPYRGAQRSFVYHSLVDVLNEHHRAGRIQAFGGSNWTAARVDEANDYARAHGLVEMTVGRYDDAQTRKRTRYSVISLSSRVSAAGRRFRRPDRSAAAAPSGWS